MVNNHTVTFACSAEALINADEVTRRLLAWSDGDEGALDRLIPLVVMELRRIAERLFRRENSGHTLQPTALINELYLRLRSRRHVSWENRAQFFGFAADTMKKILVDHARTRSAVKRGEGIRPRPLDEVTEVEAHRDLDFLVGLHDALGRLAEIDPRQERVVALTLFAGLTQEQIADVLGVTARTVKRDWRTAKLWLHKALEP